MGIYHPRDLGAVNDRASGDHRAVVSPYQQDLIERYLVPGVFREPIHVNDLPGFNPVLVTGGLNDGVHVKPLHIPGC